jgi:hypothetical protein
VTEVGFVARAQTNEIAVEAFLRLVGESADTRSRPATLFPVANAAAA